MSTFRRVPLEQVCTTINSGGTPSRREPKFWQGGKIPWIKTGELNDWKITSISERITEAGLRGSAAKLYAPGTVLIAMYGDGRTITTMGIVDRPAATNQACCALTANPDHCDQLYLFYALKHRRSELLNLVVAGAQRNLSVGTIRKFEVEIPSLETQRRIASILGTYDDLIEVNRRRVAVLEEMARGLFEEWFVRFRFPGHESVTIENTPDGPLPNGWREGPIKAVYDGLYDGPHATPVPSDAGPIFLGIGNITEAGQMDLSSVRHIAEEDFGRWTKRVTPEQGDIVFTYEATLNRYALIPEGFRGCLGRRLALIRARSVVGMNRYLYLYFFTEAWRSTIAKNTLSGATVDRVPLKRFPEFPITIPPSDIVVAFDGIVQPMFAQLEGLAKANTLLAASRDLLLPRLISGQLSVEAAEWQLDEAA